MRSYYGVEILLCLTLPMPVWATANKPPISSDKLAYKWSFNLLSPYQLKHSGALNTAPWLTAYIYIDMWCITKTTRFLKNIMNSNLTCGLTNKLHETIFRSIMTKLGRRHVINASDIKNDLLCKKIMIIIK